MADTDSSCPKLRNQVYKYCLTNDFGIHLSVGYRHPHTLQFKRRAPKKLAVQLLTVNHAICTEASSFLYGQKIIFSNFPTFAKFSETVGVGKISLLSGIYIHTLRRCDVTVYYEGLRCSNSDCNWNVQTEPCSFPTITSASMLNKPFCIGNLLVQGVKEFSRFLDTAGDDAIKAVASLTLRQIDFENDDPQILSNISRFSNLQTIGFEACRIPEMTIFTGIQLGRGVFKHAHGWLRKMANRTNAEEVCKKNLWLLRSWYRQSSQSALRSDPGYRRYRIACDEIIRLLKLPSPDPVVHGA